MRYVLFRLVDPGRSALNAVLRSPTTAPLAAESPFAPGGEDAYLRWRERKLAHYPARVEDLIVEVRDPRRLRESERAELCRLCSIANMAVYSSPLGARADRDLPRCVGLQLGLAQPQANPLADEDGISALETTAEKATLGFIPYSNQRLLWHTDGYYNAATQRIRAFILHCVRSAASGGENRLLDHEIAYILLRDADPAGVAALSAPDAMTVPPHTVNGAERRPARTGPVFTAEESGLHMRFTERRRSIEWRPDAATGAAVQALRAILEADSPYQFSLRLAPGQGLVCNNVLHNRSAYTDAAAPGTARLVYRARYANRIAMNTAP